MITSSKRNSGIDLLRLIAIFLITVNHVLGRTGVLDYLNYDSLDQRIYWLIDIICYCAVDIFGIISGFVASNKHMKLHKIINMWLQVLFYSFCLSWIVSLLTSHDISKIELIKSALPVTYEKFWYFNSYIVVFMFAPIICKCIDNLTDEESLYVSYLIIGLFGLGLINDPFQLNSGYSAFWLVMLYILGYLLRKYEDKLKRIKNEHLLLIFVFFVVFTWFVKTCIHFSVIYRYISPTIVIPSASAVLLFSRIKINTIISKFSKHVFGIYLFQENEFIKMIMSETTYNIENTIVANILFVFILSCIVYACGMLIELIRSKIYSFFRIHKLSFYIEKQISAIAKYLLERLNIIL